MAAAAPAAVSQGLDYNEKVALGLAATFGTGLGLVTWAFNRETKLSRQAKSHLRRVSFYTLAGIGSTWGALQLSGCDAYQLQRLLTSRTSTSSNRRAVLSYVRA